jgi:hypothetical protein
MAEIDADGAAVFAEACRIGLEGLVSKRFDAPYRSGRWRTCRDACGFNLITVLPERVRPQGVRVFGLDPIARALSC